MLLRVIGGETASYIYWSKTPATVALPAGGFCVIPCCDHNGGLGPTLIGEIAGKSLEFGACAQLYVSEDHMPSLCDFATRSGAELVGAGINAHKLQDYESAWNAKAPEFCDWTALSIAVQELAESTGRRLRGRISSFEQFKRVRMALCQWQNGPMDFDDLVDLWKDAVSDGWDSAPKETVPHRCNPQ